MSDAAKLFNQLMTDRGADYVRARDALLSRNDAAEYLNSQKSNAGDAERWMAEILLQRLARREEFDHLETVFDAKMPVLVLGLPPAYQDRRPRGADLHTGFLLPTEQAPKRTLLGAASSPAIRQQEEAFAKYYESIRLPPSDCWKPFLSEILLKGWSPSTVPAVAEPRPLAEQVLDQKGIPRDRQPTLASDDYLRQAILLLGKLGEQRAAPRIVELLVDRVQDGRTRVLAARALGYLNSDAGLETLLQLAEDQQTVHLVRIEVFGALARLKDARAVPVLERIAANPDTTSLPGDRGPQRWKREARIALEKIQSE